MKVAVLGGSGYLASILSHRKNKKINFVSFSRNSKKKINRINYISFSDIRAKLKNFDCIINLVGMNKEDSKIKKYKSIKLKKKITENICRLCVLYKIKLIYISSIQIYDKFESKSKINTNNLINKKSFYSRAHYTAENIIKKKLKSTYNTYLIIRLSNVFGFQKKINQKYIYDNLVNFFCYSAKKNNTIKLSNPSVVRNFIPSRVFYDLIKKIILTQKFENNIINYGYKSYDLRSISYLIAKRCKIKFNSNVKIVYKNYKKKPKFLLEKNFYTKSFDHKMMLIEIDSLLKNLK